MTKTSDRRKGFALAVALAAIVIIGGLITGVYFASTQEYRIGRNTAFQANALSTAEYGLLDVAGPSWNTDWNSMGVGSVVNVADTVSKPNGPVANVRVTGLGNGTFLITSSGTVGPSASAQARRRVGALLALRMIQLNMEGALTTRGDLKIGGSSEIDGNDHQIPGWNCDPVGAALAGIAINDSTKIDRSGCKDNSCVSGSPKIKQSAAAGDTSNYTKFGDLDWEQLKSMATITYAVGEGTSPGPSPAPVLKGTAPNQKCNTDPYVYPAKNNWGDPRNGGPCKDYFPIIYSAGDMKLTGGMGQGMLLVEGHLSVQGGFEFYGPVIVKKSLTTQGTGGHFNGGVMAANVALEQNVVLGNAVVSFSRCAITKALQKSSKPGMVANRSWVELY